MKHLSTLRDGGRVDCNRLSTLPRRFLVKYKLPDPPASGVVWTRDPENGAVYRWDREEVDGFFWSANDVDMPVLAWGTLLGSGREVFDAHPDFADLPPFPWRVSLVDGAEYEIFDAGDEFVFQVRGEHTSSDTDKLTAKFIVDTVNAYVSGVDR